MINDENNLNYIRFKCLEQVIKVNFRILYQRDIVLIKDGVDCVANQSFIYVVDDWKKLAKAIELGS